MAAFALSSQVTAYSVWAVLYGKYYYDLERTRDAKKWIWSDWLIQFKRNGPNLLASNYWKNNDRMRRFGDNLSGFNYNYRYGTGSKLRTYFTTQASLVPYKNSHCWIDIAPPSHVAVLRSYVNIASTIGLSLGGPLGGYLGGLIGWRWWYLKLSINSRLKVN